MLDIDREVYPKPSVWGVGVWVLGGMSVSPGGPSPREASTVTRACSRNLGRKPEVAARSSMN